ncbi:trehalose operon repressor [Atopobacter phocae]|uniref:trehalose operon repressor n=1 Tax=Atopobacter phocae TaxID=136492 RepID=UPI0004704709|nr:trehalose operon repressor [Atopobacter phocae]
MTSKFKYIYSDLKNKILTKEIKAGDYLPSENELSEQYSTSRETIRKALKILFDEGMINKQRGKGSIVLQRDLYPLPFNQLTSFKELNRMKGESVQTKVLFNEVVSPPSFLVNKKIIEADEKIWKIKRLRYIDNRPSIIDIDYIKRLSFKPATDDILENSLYDYLENECKLSIGYAEKEISAEIATVEDLDLLQMNDSHVIVVQGDVYLNDTTWFQYTESRHKIDRFKFLDFSRRYNHDV